MKTADIKANLLLIIAAILVIILHTGVKKTNDVIVEKNVVVKK